MRYCFKYLVFQIFAGASFVLAPGVANSQLPDFPVLPPLDFECRPGDASGTLEIPPENSPNQGYTETYEVCSPLGVWRTIWTRRWDEACGEKALVREETFTYVGCDTAPSSKTTTELKEVSAAEGKCRLQTNRTDQEREVPGDCQLERTVTEIVYGFQWGDRVARRTVTVYPKIVEEQECPAPESGKFYTIKDGAVITTTTHYDVDGNVVPAPVPWPINPDAPPIMCN